MSDSDDAPPRAIEAAAVKLLEDLTGHMTSLAALEAIAERARCIAEQAMDLGIARPGVVLVDRHGRRWVPVRIWHSVDGELLGADLAEEGKTDPAWRGVSAAELEQMEVVRGAERKDHGV